MLYLYDMKKDAKSGQKRMFYIKQGECRLNGNQKEKEAK